jgi:hypothetical protein
MTRAMDLLESVMKWVVAPVAAFVWVLYRTVQLQGTEIAVLKAILTANKEAHDREFKEMRDNFKSVMSKLDSIEQALRK